MSALSIGVLASLLLLLLPAAVGGGLFLVLLKVWLPAAFRKESVKLGLALSISGKRATWSIPDDKLPWPKIEIEWAVAAAIAALLWGVSRIGDDPNLKLIWFTAGSANAMIALAAPWFLWRFSRRQILHIVRREMLLALAPRGEEAKFVAEIGEFGAGIAKDYIELGLKTEICPNEICKRLLVQRAAGEIPGAKEKLQAARNTLGRFVRGLAKWMELHRPVQREFDLTKNMIIDTGSVTLLGELDRVKLLLTSAELARHLDTGRWDRAKEMLDHIAFDLRMLRNMVEGGTDIPLSLGEACKALNVSKDASEKAVKAVVDALRRVWHPDLVECTEERERRTAKSRQINAAWEIFRECGGGQGAETGPAIEPAVRQLTFSGA